MNEARADSIYERLRARGLLDRVMRELYDREKDFKQMARWLQLEGVPTSHQSLYAMVRDHGLAWRYERNTAIRAAQGDTAPLDESAARTLNTKLGLLTFELDGVKELALLAKVQGDTRKIQILEGKLEIAQRELELKIEESQRTTAELVEEIFANADSIQALKAERDELKAAGATVRDIVDAIRRRLYGAGANSGKEAPHA